MLFDAHAHLHPSFCLSPDIRILANAVNRSDWDALKIRAHENSRITPYLGIHPWASADQEIDDSVLNEIAEANCGIGEIGLDRSPRGLGIPWELQLRRFRAFWDLACGLSRPVSLHLVRSWGAFGEILGTTPGDRTPPFLVHGFTGSRETAEELIRRGGYLSFGPGLHEPKGRRPREIFRTLPEDRILLESDLLLTDRSDQEGILRAHYTRAAEIRGVEPRRLISIIETNGQIFTNPAHSGTGRTR